MKPAQLHKLGIPKGEPLKVAETAVKKSKNLGMDKSMLRSTLQDVVANPQAYLRHVVFGELARTLMLSKRSPR